MFYSTNKKEILSSFDNQGMITLSYTHVFFYDCSRVGAISTLITKATTKVDYDSNMTRIWQSYKSRLLIFAIHWNHKTTNCLNPNIREKRLSVFICEPEVRNVEVAFIRIVNSMHWTCIHKTQIIHVTTLMLLFCEECVERGWFQVF